MTTSTDTTPTAPAPSPRVPLSQRSLGWRGVAAVSVVSVALGGAGAALLGAVTGGGEGGMRGPGGFRGGFPGQMGGFPGQMGGAPGQQGGFPGQQGGAPGQAPGQQQGQAPGQTAPSGSASGSASPSVWSAGLAGRPVGSPHHRALHGVVVTATAPRDDVRPDAADVVTTAV